MRMMLHPAILQLAARIRRNEAIAVYRKARAKHPVDEQRSPLAEFFELPAGGSRQILDMIRCSVTSDPGF